MSPRRAALTMKLGLMDQPIIPRLLEPLLEAWRALSASSAAPTVVRSSALVEDRFGTSFAGQFESYLGLEDEAEFITAVRSCWAALWSTRVLRYMATHDASPADTAMSELVSTYFTNFAKSGNPNGAGLPQWPAFTEQKQQVMFLDAKSSARPVPNVPQLTAFEKYFAWHREHAH